MAKLTNVRERVHQPFRDTLIRTSGLYASNVQDRTDLFTQAGKNDAESNLKNGSTLPSDQSMVVLALRVFTWFRSSVARFGTLCGDKYTTAAEILLANGDYNPFLISCKPPATAVNTLNGQAVGDYHDVYRLHWQAEEQILWSFGSGQKFSLTSMPTAYFPYGGGLYGDLGHAGTACCNVKIANELTDTVAFTYATNYWPMQARYVGQKVRFGLSPCEKIFGCVLNPPLVPGGTWTMQYANYDTSMAVWEPLSVAVNVESFPFKYRIDEDYEINIPAQPTELVQKSYALMQFKPNPQGCGPLIHWENGSPDHSGILRLARAILLPPRQNVLCQANIVRLPDGGNGGTFGVNQNARNLLSLTDNLNAVDLVQKVVSFTFDGLFSRDVQ